MSSDSQSEEDSRENGHEHERPLEVATDCRLLAPKVERSRETVNSYLDERIICTDFQTKHKSYFCTPKESREDKRDQAASQDSPRLRSIIGSVGYLSNDGPFISTFSEC